MIGTSEDPFFTSLPGFRTSVLIWFFNPERRVVVGVGVVEVVRPDLQRRDALSCSAGKVLDFQSVVGVVCGHRLLLDLALKKTVLMGLT